MGRFLDGSGVLYLWNKLKGYVDEKFSQTGQGADGKSAYQYAVDGGYTGTEAEFQALMGSGPWLPAQGGGTVSGSISMQVDGMDIPYIVFDDAKALRYDSVTEALACVPAGEAGYASPSLSPFACGDPTHQYHAANKAYVDGLFNQVAPVIVKVQLCSDFSGTVIKSYNVKCYPAATGISSYSINFSPGNMRDLNLAEVVIIPPDSYAFSNLYASSGIVLTVSGNNQGVQDYYGIVYVDGSVHFYTSLGMNDLSWIITGSFTLEVA